MPSANNLSQVLNCFADTSTTIGENKKAYDTTRVVSSTLHASGNVAHLCKSKEMSA